MLQNTNITDGKFENQLNIRDAVLPNYWNVLNSLNGNINIASLPDKFLRPEFRKANNEIENLDLAKSVIAPYIPDVALQACYVEKPIRKVDRHESGASELQNHISGIANGIASVKMFRSNPLVFEGVESSAGLEKLDIIGVCSMWAEEMFALELYRNPAGKTAPENFTAKCLSALLCERSGCLPVDRELSSDEFNEIRLCASRINTNCSRFAFRFIDKAGILIMPNFSSPLLVLSVPESVKCSVIFTCDEIDGIEYDKIDLFFKKNTLNSLSADLRYAIIKLISAEDINHEINAEHLLSA